MTLKLRKARPEDRQRTFEIEKQATPGLSYLPYVFDQFVTDEQGEFIIAELDGEAVGCGKFTVLPDGSAWLETLRVIPEKQGLGIGKQFYTRFFEIARAQKILAMRMYTNIRNYASKGLAERFGFSIAGTYRGQKRACQPNHLRPDPAGFQPVTDPALASGLLLSFQEAWAGFLVMNRTFYAITPALAQYLAQQGMLYHDPITQTTVALGARFMPHQAVHLGVLGGNLTAALAFALYQGMQTGVERLSCFYPPAATEIEAALCAQHFEFESSDFIVMEVKLAP